MATSQQGYEFLNETLESRGRYFSQLFENLKILKGIKPYEKVNLNTLVLIYDVVSDGKEKEQLLMGEIGFVKDIHWTTVIPTTSSSLDDMLMDKKFGFNDDNELMEIFLDENTLSIPVEFDERHAEVGFSKECNEPEFSEPDSKHGLVSGDSFIAVNPYEINITGRKVAPAIPYLASEFFKYLKE